jgi:hypothetical protein
MRSALLAALLGSSVFATPALAQGQPQVTPNVVPQGEAQGKAAVAECQQLISLLQSAPREAGVTEEQARRWLVAGDAQSCTEARDRVQAQISPNQTTSTPAPNTGAGAAPASPAGTIPPAPTGSIGYLREVPPGIFSAERLKGVEVIGADITRIGEIEDVMVDRTGRVAAVVIGVGGFLGIGSKSVAVPFEALLFNFEASPTDGPSSSNTGTGLQTQMAPNNSPTSPGVNTTAAGGAAGRTAPTAETSGTGGQAATGSPGPLTTMAEGSGSETANRTGMEAAMGGAPALGPATVPVVTGELKRVVLRATKAELQNAPEFRKPQ